MATTSFSIVKTDCNITSPNGLYAFKGCNMLISQDFVLALAQDENDIVRDFMRVSGTYEEGLPGLLQYGLSIQSWDFSDEEDPKGYFIVHPDGSEVLLP